MTVKRNSGGKRKFLTVVNGTKKKHKKEEEIRAVLKDALDGTPEPPDFLNVDGVKIWVDASNMLISHGELAKAHLYGLTELAYLWQDIVKIMRDGDRVPGNIYGRFNKRMIEYGMTPRATHELDPTGEKSRAKPTGKRLNKEERAAKELDDSIPQGEASHVESIEDRLERLSA